MKKLSIILLIATMLSIVAYSQEPTQIPAGGNPLTWRTIINTNMNQVYDTFGVHLDTLRSHRNAINLNYSFIRSNADSITKIKDVIIPLRAPITNPTFIGIIKLGTDTIATQAYARLYGGGGGTTDTTSLSNRINLKLSIADTASMLSNYALLSEVGEGASMVYPGAGIALSSGSAWETSITNNSSNWNTAYSDRLKWDGGSTGLTAATGRTSLGGTTAGQALFTLSNPSAITFLRVNANNSVTALSAADFRTATATVGTADTSSMLTPYITDDEARKAINDSLTARLNGATEISDVAVMLADSTGNAPGNYVTRKALSDSIAANAGSVAGITLNGGTLTLSGGDALTFETGGDYTYTLPQTSGGTLMLMSEIQTAIRDSLLLYAKLSDLTEGGISLSAVQEEIADSAVLLSDIRPYYTFGAGTGADADSTLFAKGNKSFGSFRIIEDSLYVHSITNLYMTSGDSLKFNVYYGNGMTRTATDSLFTAPQGAGSYATQTLTPDNERTINHGQDVWVGIIGPQPANMRPKEWILQLNAKIVRD